MKLFFLIAFMLGSLACRAANSAETAFAEANRSYEQGKYAEAALLYQTVVSNAPTASAWYNLGNAEFKAGRLGYGIAAWRRAEQIEPRDTLLRANIAFARTKLSDASPESSPLTIIRRYVRTDEWTIIAMIGFAAGFLILAWSEWRRSAKPRFILATIFLISLLCASASAANYRDSFVRKQSVVIAKQVPIRFGPLEESQIGFQLNDGTEVVVLDSSPGWYQIRDSSGRSGWARQDAMILISP
jgi:tetratricopeptide (TPR) repeat protein